jgi:truncated hemoglobin YjbI
VSRRRLNNLFHRIGGESGLQNILRDFYHRMEKDILIGYFFSGKDIDAVADMQKQFLMHAMGARPNYLGKPPGKAHEHLPTFLPGHFDRRLTLLRETLKDHHLDQRDIDTWIEFEDSFRSLLVKEPKSN